METSPALTGADGGSSLPALEVMPDECAKMALALAYFCVACGREHASGSVREGDVQCAEADIVAAIRRAQ